MTDPTLKPDMSRIDLAHLFCEMGYKSGAEIGTARGAYAYSLARANPQATIYCIDPWKTYADYADITSQAIMDQNYRKACEQLKPFNNVKLMKEYSGSAAKLFNDNDLDFVYIDGNHETRYVLYDIHVWSRKVRSGGIISGHDYGENEDVTRAVDKYAKIFEIDPWFVIGSPSRAQSWYWVKP